MPAAARVSILDVLVDPRRVSMRWLTLRAPNATDGMAIAIRAHRPTALQNMTASLPLASASSTRRRRAYTQTGRRHRFSGWRVRFSGWRVRFDAQPGGVGSDADLVVREDAVPPVVEYRPRHRLPGSATSVRSGSAMAT